MGFYRTQSTALNGWVRMYSCMGIRYVKRLTPQNPFSNHEIHVLFEHVFYLKKRKLGPDLHAHDVTLERVAATDHFADAVVRENVARVYMTLWRRNDV